MSVISLEINFFIVRVRCSFKLPFSVPVQLLSLPVGPGIHHALSGILSVGSAVPSEPLSTFPKTRDVAFPCDSKQNPSVS